jgi:hypothetical protein
MKDESMAIQFASAYFHPCFSSSIFNTSVQGKERTRGRAVSTACGSGRASSIASPGALPQAVLTSLCYQLGSQSRNNIDGQQRRRDS